MIFEVVFKEKIYFQIFNTAAIVAEGPSLPAARALLRHDKFEFFMVSQKGQKAKKTKLGR